MKKRIAIVLVLCITLVFLLTMLTGCPESNYESNNERETKIELTTKNCREYLSINGTFKGDPDELVYNSLQPMHYKGGISEVNVSPVASYLAFENCEITISCRVKYDNLYMDDYTEYIDHTITLSIGGTGHSILHPNLYYATKIYGVTDVYVRSIKGYVILK